ncbi:hypothetical protein AgCh_019978 [Apium graveolens]
MAPTYMVLSLLSANGSQVKASVDDLFIPAIMHSNSFINCTSIFFVLSLTDDTFDMGVDYDNITLNFYYLGNNTSSINISVANYTWPGFYQKSHEHGSTTKLSDYVVTQGFLLDNEALKNVPEIVIRVNLATAVRFKYSWLKSKTHAFLVQGNVKLSTITGKKIERQGVRLRSYTRQESGGHYKATIYFFMFFVFIVTAIWIFSIQMACSG